MAEEPKKEPKTRFNIYTVISDILTGKAEQVRTAGNIFKAFGFKSKKEDVENEKKNQ